MYFYVAAQQNATWNSDRNQATYIHKRHVWHLLEVTVAKACWIYQIFLTYMYY